jgi:pyroglutamyl-peptidase
VPAEPLRVVVTGFGGFPGSAKNPTAGMIAELAGYRSRFARLGIRLELCVLPVIYAKIEPSLAFLARKIRPHAILHFGVAPRRTKFCVEARALNRLSLLHSDASGARSQHRAIVAKAPMSLRSTVPAEVIAAALRRNGFDGAVSIDAGDYVCNQTLFLSLSLAPQKDAPLVGFIHVPPLAARHRRSFAGKRLGVASATRAAAIAILALAPKLRSARARPGFHHRLKYPRPI